jgi:tetratricopeptide (TPR) repeat protein
VAEAILSRVALREGHADEALRRAKHAAQVLGEIGDREQQADALGAVGGAYEALGLTRDADAAYAASLDLYTTISDIANRSEMAAEYARVLKARGDTERAFEMLELARGGAKPH